MVVNVGSVHYRVCVYWKLVYVVFNVGSVHYRVCVYWKLVYVVVNVGRVHYRVCVLEIGVCGCKCRECAL